MKGFRDKIRRFFLDKGKDDKPIIITPWGPVTESARFQAAMNMKSDPLIKTRVEALLCKQLGSITKGMAEARRCYPEAYE